MAKFSDSNYDILKEYFSAVLGEGVGLGDSWLLGPKTGIIGEGGVAEILWEDNPQRGLVAHKFIIQDIDGNSFNMAYDGLVSTFSLASSAFEIGNDFYFRKDSFFYQYLFETNPEFRDYINQERTFCYFGKIWPVTDRQDVWNIEFYGMKDYMELAIPIHNRTPRLVEMMDVWFDQINHEPYNMTKYLWALLDSKEVDIRWLDYIASQYGIDVNIDLDEVTLREWVDLLVYFLKRIGTYNAIYIVYKVFTALSANKVNVYERWEEWCQKGAGDMPSFTEFPNFFPGTKDFHWFEFYNIPPSGGAGDVWYSQFNPSGAPTPNPYSGIEIDPYPTHALSEPLPGCSSVSATPTGSLVIAPHYIVEIDLTTEPIGDRFDSDWIINNFYADELVRNWEYARPVNKYVQYQHLLAPASEQNRTGEPESLYPLTSLGYFNTSFTGSQYLSGGSNTPSGGLVAYTYAQQGASARWTVTHELSSSHVVVQAWAPVAGPAFYPLKRVIPDEIEIIDENTVYLDFGYEQYGGLANVAGYIPTVSDKYDQVAPTNPWSVIHNLGTTAPSGYPIGSVVNYWTSPNKSQPADVKIITSNKTDATWYTTESGSAFTRNADYVHTQTVASTAWNINHGMNTDGTIIQCFDSSNELIQPLTTILEDESNITVTFVTAQSGKAYLLYFKRDVISRLNNECDITTTGICAGGLGYWQVGDGAAEDYNAYEGGGLQSPTASGDYWRVWEDEKNYYIDFIVPAGEDLTIREVGLFNYVGQLIYYSVCSELYKPADVQTVFDYRSQKLWVTESSSSSSSSSSVSSSSTSSSSSSSSVSSSSLSESSSSSSSTIPWFVVDGGVGTVVPGPGFVPGNSDFTLTNIESYDNTYVYKDFGPGYFDDAFLINFDINWINVINSVGADTWWGVGVTTSPGTLSHMGTVTQGLAGTLQGLVTFHRAYTRDFSGGTQLGGDPSSYLDIPNVQTFYYQIERNTDIPGNDRFFFRRYTNPARTAGLFEMQHNGTFEREYRYLIFANIGVTFTGATFTATIANIDVVSH